MVSIRSKKMKKFRTIKRETVFKPVEEARFAQIMSLLNAPKPEVEKPEVVEADEDDKMETEAVEEKPLTKLGREQLMLSRNQFKKRQNARSSSKKAKAKKVLRQHDSSFKKARTGKK
ncbi:hypothetical protein HDU98_000800 [Podochytrium sp. JEL0797]|nr:hypothetical protein HDU98_000800 [Podochytrium sp. JEL0797]